MPRKGARPEGCGNRTNRADIFPTFAIFKLLRWRKVANSVFAEIKEMQAQAVFNFAFAEIVQIGLPMPIVNEVVGDVLRNKNMAGVSAIEDALRDIYAGSSDIHSIIHVGNLVDRSTVDSHPHLNSSRASQFFCNLQGAADWLFQVLEKKQRHSVAGR